MNEYIRNNFTYHWFAIPAIQELIYTRCPLFPDGSSSSIFRWVQSDEMGAILLVMWTLDDIETNEAFYDFHNEILHPMYKSSWEMRRMTFTDEFWADVRNNYRKVKEEAARFQKLEAMFAKFIADHNQQGDGADENEHHQ